jgi:hypothetical protein
VSLDIEGLVKDPSFKPYLEDLRLAAKGGIDFESPAFNHNARW